jgi:apolipoprotein N-acyltransferase
MNDLADATRRVAEHARTLLELEVKLAIEEMKRKAATIGLGVGLSAGALMFLWLAILFGLGAATAGLTYVVPVWGALLIMCATVLVIALLLAAVGIALIRRAATPPEETIAQAQLMMEDLQEEMHDAGLS